MTCIKIENRISRWSAEVVLLEWWEEEGGQWKRGCGEGGRGRRALPALAKREIRMRSTGVESWVLVLEKIDIEQARPFLDALFS